MPVVQLEPALLRVLFGAADVTHAYAIAVGYVTRCGTEHVAARLPHRALNCCDCSARCYARACAARTGGCALLPLTVTVFVGTAVLPVGTRC